MTEAMTTKTEGKQIADQIKAQLAEFLPGKSIQVCQYDPEHLFSSDDTLIWIVYVKGKYAGGFQYDRQTKRWERNNADNFAETPPDLHPDVKLTVDLIVGGIISDVDRT